MEHVLPGGGQGGQRPAVKAVFQPHDGGTALPVFVKAVFAGQLDGAFVGLRPRIAEENAAHPRRGAQLGGELHLHRAVIEIGNMLQSRGLLLHRPHPALVTVAQGVDPDAAAEVDVGAALHVDGRGPVSAGQRHGEPAVGGHQRGVVLFLYLVERHNPSPPLTGTWCRCLRRSAFRSKWNGGSGRR